MIFDSALTDTKICGDILAGMTRENHCHDLLLTHGQRGHEFGRVLMPNRAFALILRLRECSINAVQQLEMLQRLFDKILCTSFHSPHRHCDVAVAGHHDRLKLTAVVSKTLKKLQSTHAGKIAIDQ